MALDAQAAEETRFQVDLLLEMLDQLELRIRRISKRIEQRVEVTREARLLKTVPGIGDKTGLLIRSEIGTLERFRSPSGPPRNRMGHLLRIQNPVLATHEEAFEDRLL